MMSSVQLAQQSPVRIMHDYLGLLAANKIQEAITAFRARDPAKSEPMLDQYIFACLQKRVGQTESACSIIDAMAELILAKAAGDNSPLDLMQEKIIACWIASVIERGTLRANLEKIGHIIACDYLIEDELSELYPLVSKAYQFLRNAGAAAAPVINMSRAGWTFQITKSSVDSLAFFMDWLPRHHNSPESGDKFYRNFAKYQSGNHDRERDVARLVWNELGDVLIPGGKILDAGCGDALVVKLLLEKISLQVFGIDGVARAEGLAKANVPSMEFKVSDLENVPYPDGHFDLVFTSDTIEHVLRPHKVIRELCRLTRPGGHLFISVPDGRFDNYIGHINFFTTQSLGVLVEELCAPPKVGMHSQGIFAVVKKPEGNPSH